MKLSIIIPMYNAGRFIVKCLDSCHTLPEGVGEVEVIVIDDGSTDTSAQIVKEYALTHPCVHLYSQPNSRQGAARNNGLTKASGDYVWFVDADDWIAAGDMEQIFKLLEKGTQDGMGLDVLAFGMRNFTTESHVESEFRYDSGFEGSGKEFICRMDEKLKLCPPLYIYRREYLSSRELRFIPGVFHEDVDFIPRSVYFAERLKAVQLMPYSRLLHASSVTNTAELRRVGDLVKVIGSLHDFVRHEEKPGSPTYRALCGVISNVCNYGCRIAASMDEEIEREYNGHIAGYKWLRHVLLSSTKMKYRFEGMLLGLMPGRFAQIHDFLMRFK